MYILNNDKMLPEIFSETQQLFQKVLQDLVTFKDSLLIENEQAKVKTFFEQYVNYQTNGLQVFKTSMGDLCVGLKALGNKFGSLGGTSFDLLAKASEQLIASTGEFINYVTSFIVTTEQVMQESEQNVQTFNDLSQNVQKYVNELVAIFNDLREATIHLYGDAKNRLQDKFEAVEKSLVNFIHMAKIKIVSALANAFVSIKLGYDYFAGLVDVKLENVYENSLLNKHGEVDKPLTKELLTKIIVNFDEALNQALKMHE